jgi:uncharacterized metal-binding protein YceD (DUF177 family)
MDNTIQTHLPSPTIIAKVPTQITSYKLTKKQDWVADLLTELNENVPEKTPEQAMDESYLNIDFTLQKKYKASLGEYVILIGTLKTEYLTECIKTLKEMRDEIEVSIKACFIDNIHETAPEYKDQIDIYDDGDVYELHFYSERNLDIKEMIHEVIYLNKNQYPTLEDTGLDPLDQPVGPLKH